MLGAACPQHRPEPHRLIEDLRDGRRREVDATIERSSVGLLTGSEITEELQGVEFRSLDPSHPKYGKVEGVLVAGVEPGSPAARTGQRPGDIVLSVNRVPVRSVDELSRALRAVGGAIALHVLRDETRLFVVIQ